VNVASSLQASTTTTPVGIPSAKLRPTSASTRAWVFTRCRSSTAGSRTRGAVQAVRPRRGTQPRPPWVSRGTVRPPRSGVTPCRGFEAAEEWPEHPGVALDRSLRAGSSMLLGKEGHDGLAPARRVPGGGGQVLGLHRRAPERTWSATSIDQVGRNSNTIRRSWSFGSDQRAPGWSGQAHRERIVPGLSRSQPEVSTR
jgi:hypothetical protein